MGKSNLQNIEAGMMKRRSSERQQENMATAPFGQLSQEAKDAMLIPVAQIVQSPFQSRAKMDEEHIESLLDTIGRDGLLSPIVVRRLDEHGVAKLKDRLAEGVSVTDTCLDFSQPIYELVTGHHRAEVFRRMRRETIPALIRYLDDREAAYALTADNTSHKQLTHWELYKHIDMLERVGAANNNSALARLLNFPRTNVIYLKSFGLLPKSVHPLLDAHPSLIGYMTAHALKDYAVSHPKLVHEAIEAAANKKIKDSGIVSYVERAANPKDKVYHEEQTIKRAGRSVKVTMTDDFTKVSHEIDPNKLLSLIDQHFDQLLRD